MAIFEEVGDRAGLAVTLRNMGRVYENIDQLEQALATYQEAVPIFEEVGNSAGESVTRYNIAMIYRAQERLAEAVAELRWVVDLDRQVQHPDLEQAKAMLAQVEAELAEQS